MRRGLAIAGAVAAGIWAWGEWQNRRWSLTLVNDPPGSSEAIVVLGFKNPQPDANFVNQIRVQVALRSIDPTAETRLIFSGGPTAATRSEARVMADYAVNELGYQGAYLLEEESRTTWDNIANSLPMIEDVDRIKIASLPAHALKARVYVRRQRPDLASKLVKAADYKFGEWAALKPALAAYSQRTLRAVREDLP
ncbi:YdcF family protein [Brachybacterium sp. MASK1Z-5]|uniref:YdcF family protein n=1 Tax=Brachybacterium halotolerans TaxID=2795215 RepID=A0ABS1B8D1_9MICO|nr:YdcF family protein [Brachybacterium halotolerans]MBK0330909.1 YdcF family protein [Brachybacterium halotolerans]